MNDSEKKVEIKKPDKWKTVILAIAIALVFTFFIALLIQSVYPNPKPQTYCGNRPYFISNNYTLESCKFYNGTWLEYGKPYPYGGNETEIGYCEIKDPCQIEFEKKSEVYNRNVFFTTILIGLITIIVGVALSLPSVSSGLMGGGLLLLFYGTIRYWGELSNLLRAIIFGFVLIILIELAYKKVKA